MALKQMAEDYFTHMSSTSKRLCQDLSDTKLAYETLWPTLNDGEKADIINETIIKPEACLQYAHVKHQPIMETRSFATKTITDECTTFRDEHSGPFSFRTTSQLDLRLFPNAKRAEVERQRPQKIKMAKVPLQPVVKTSPATTIDLDMDADDTYSSSIPKTGLDLLDNW